MSKRSKGELVRRTNIKKEKGYIYFLDDEGDLMRTKLIAPPGKKMKFVVVKKLGIKKKSGYVYFLDTEGSIRKISLEKNKLRK